MKRICLIGSGNVAEALACALSASAPVQVASTGEQFCLDRIYARNQDRGNAVAQMAGCSYTNNPAELQSADIILIATTRLSLPTRPDPFRGKSCPNGCTIAESFTLCKPSPRDVKSIFGRFHY